MDAPRPLLRPGGCRRAAGTAWQALRRADARTEDYVWAFGTGRRCVSSPGAFLSFRAAQFALTGG